MILSEFVLVVAFLAMSCKAILPKKRQKAKFYEEIFTKLSAMIWIIIKKSVLFANFLIDHVPGQTSIIKKT